jgi:hypothetical protein
MKGEMDEASSTLWENEKCTYEYNIRLKISSEGDTLNTKYQS